MTAMLKDLVDIEETAIRREAMRTRLGICGAVLGRRDTVMRKGDDDATELASLEFDTHASRVQLLEIEVAAVQAQIDAQESAGVSNPNVEPPCHTAN